MSHGRPPFCNLRISPSSELLCNKTWLHRFDVISLYIMSGRNNMRYKYYRICLRICMTSVTLGGKLGYHSLGIRGLKSSNTTLYGLSRAAKLILKYKAF